MFMVHIIFTEAQTGLISTFCNKLSSELVCNYNYDYKANVIMSRYNV